MLDFMQDDADEIVLDTAGLHKGAGTRVCINQCLVCIFKHQPRLVFVEKA